MYNTLTNGSKTGILCNVFCFLGGVHVGIRIYAAVALFIGIYGTVISSDAG